MNQVTMSHHLPLPKPQWLSNPSYTNLLTHHPTLLPLFLSASSPRHLPQLHAHLITTSLIHRPYPASALLELSALSPAADLPLALLLLRSLNLPTIFAYNTIIRAFSSSPTPHLSISIFFELLNLGLTPNKYTYPFLLKAGSIPAASLHAQILKLGIPADPFINSSLIHGYTNHSNIGDARKLFDRIPDRNTVCWSSLLSGYVQWGRFREALELFSAFQRGDAQPNESMLVSVLTAAAHLGALQQGRWTHSYIRRKCNADEGSFGVKIGTALVNMYCRCGAVGEAEAVFEMMMERNVLTWTAMISGMAVNGISVKALGVFDEMVRDGVRPDAVTFLGVLAACSHGGLVEEGRQRFDEMVRVYRVRPEVEHYGCMVDLLARAGRLREALQFIGNSPVAADAAAWSSLLHACRAHNDFDLGVFVGRRLIEWDPLNDANYVLLANVYSQAGQWGGAVEVRRLMRERGVRKQPGCSAVEVDGVVHEFFAGDESVPVELQPMLVEMRERLAAAGYVPSTAVVLLDVDEGVKRRVLCYHSEKVAIAFGLMNVGERGVIRVVKNLRACEDCHSATKVLSRVYGREIVVRDRQRFHHFKDGVCSCSDHW